jgi:peptidoglycan/xylan/chitin deacetylase (PgdA/CDA1 family)
MMIFYLALVFTAVVAGLVLFLASYYIYSLIQEYRHDRVPVLLYHRILSKEKAERGEIIDSEPVYVSYDTVFAEQMAYLCREGYTTISPDDFIAFQTGEKPLPPKPIMLTCDDGFMSNYRYAFPILKKHGMQATIFVTPDTESENFKTYAYADSPLTHEQLREMSDYGISIESHAMTHRYLTELEPEVVRWELEESKRVLEGILQKPVQFLAIPSGAYNKTVKRLAKEAGYKAIFCTLKGSNNARSNRYALRRLVVARDFTIDDFQRILQPTTACQLRLTSFFQNLSLSILGPHRQDALRNTLYRTRLASFIIFGQFKYFVGSLAVMVVVLLILGITILLVS